MIKALLFLLGSLVLSFLWAPLWIGFLYRFNIRRRTKEELDRIVETQAQKRGVPVMGGRPSIGRELSVRI